MLKSFKRFAALYNVSDKQIKQFQIYLELLQSESKQINLTTITEIDDIIEYHFSDSLRVTQFLDFMYIKSVCDIGTGAGFPGLPLKILYPHLKLILIEVNNKKIRFLRQVITALALEDVEISAFDWRTFLRQSSYQVDLFVTRAALRPEDLVRMFSPAYTYEASQLVYWASAAWKPSIKITPFLQRQETYHSGGKKRKLIFFKR